MKTLFEFIKKHYGLYLAGILAMLAGVVLDMFNPKQVQRIIDDVIIGGKTGLFAGILLVFAGITAGRAVFGYLKEYMFDMASSSIIAKFRIRLFDHIQRQSFSFFDKINTGELMSRMKEDTENVMNVICYGIMLLIEQALYFVIAAVILFTIDWKLASVSLAMMPVIAFIAFRLEKRIGKTFEKISDQRAVLNTTAQENLAGVRLVKAFGREKHEIEKFLRQNEEISRLNIEQSYIWAKFQPLMDYLTNAVSVLIISVGGFLVIGGEMSVGTLVSFNLYAFMLIWPMRMIGWLVNMMAQCLASLKKIDKIFAEQPEIENPPDAFSPANIEGHIEFRNVSLSLDGTEILRDITFEARTGSTIAIMGGTGSGKSSLVHLIGRYYDRTSGSILIDGHDVREYDLQALRRGISVVMQDVFLFSDTIKENIIFGCDNSALQEEQEGQDERMTLASKDAHIHDFIARTSDGYETVIGERGIGLSGGQKQRISIARAMVRDCGILILDDSTSALDIETEHQIQESIDKKRGMTKLIIAHRVSAVKNADEILFLEDGRITERGTHKELLDLRGRYYETYKIQFQGLFADTYQGENQCL
ncbi:MAG: ABC transporter ATP-binding protein [Saccharofermentanales bacterium]